MNSECNPAQQKEPFTAIAPGARAALAVLLVINLLNYIDRQVLASVVDFIESSFFPKGGTAHPSAFLVQLQQWCQLHLGFKPELAFIGVLGMAFMAVYMIAVPIFGRLAETYSRWTLIGIGVILWSLASGASGLAGGFFALLLTRCFVGVGEAAYGPVAPALLSDFYPVRIRGRVLACFYLAIPVGSALGFVVGDMIARSNIGAWGNRVLGIQAESWRWAFYLVVIPGILLGLWSFFMKEPPRVESTRRRVALRDYQTLLKTPSYVLCTLGMTAMTFSLGGIAFWMAYYLKQKPGAPAAVTTIFGTLTVVAGLAATLTGGWAGDKLRERFPGSYFLVSGAMMIAGFPFFIMTLYSPFPTLWIWLFISVFCLFFNTGPSNTILANVSHSDVRAAGFALNITVIHLFGDVISPVIIGILGDRYGMNAAFVGVAFMFIVSGTIWLAGSRFLKRDTELALSRPRS